MKLCPLFESIDYSPVPLGTSGIWFTAGVKAANAKLPREAIEEAISVMEIEDISPAHIEQLRALLPEGD
jgi:hypothetical protein